MARPLLLVKLGLAVLGGLLVLWYQAVVRLAAVKRRKHARRRARILSRP